MFIDGTYFSVGVSPDGESFVMQTFIPDVPGPGVVYTGLLSELDGRGASEANCIIGCLMIGFMRVYFPNIGALSESLMPVIKFKPLDFDPCRDRSGAKREPHLRIRAASNDRSIVIQQCHRDRGVGNERLVILDPLIEAGPDAVVDMLGSTTLEGLAALHPDVFVHYGTLTT